MVPAPLSILIAFGTIACLAIVLRWTYGSDTSDRRLREADRAPAGFGSPMFGAQPPERPEPEIDPARAAAHDVLPEPAEDVVGVDEGYGLLRTVLSCGDAEEAGAVRATLRAGGVRSTIAPRADGRVAVLVFGDQWDQARRLVR